MQEEILQKRTIKPNEKMSLSTDNPDVILKLDYPPSVISYHHTRRTLWLHQDFYRPQPKQCSGLCSDG